MTAKKNSVIAKNIRSMTEKETRFQHNVRLRLQVFPGVQTIFPECSDLYHADSDMGMHHTIIVIF